MGADQIYHGVDLIEIDRVSHAITRWGALFLQRVFTDQEIADCNGRTSSFAARFAAKEAAAKALGAGLRGVGAGDAAAVGWRDIEVVRAPSGQPFLRLHRRAAERAAALGWRAISVSLSHGRDTAVASVVALGAPLAGSSPSVPSHSDMVE